MLYEDGSDDLSIIDEELSDSSPTVFPPKFHVMGSHPVREKSPQVPESSSIEVSPEEMLYIGVNGRCNKVSDTCYTFWVGGSLGVSPSLPVVSSTTVH